MSEYAIYVDWSVYDEKWEMVGRNRMYDLITTEGSKQNKEAREQYDEGLDIEVIADEVADQEIPMMNYAYPLQIEPSDEKIVEVCERTACTVVYNNDTDEYFLALCGGGMDLSQDIALAYIIAQTWLPLSLISQVSSQKGLSKSGETFEEIRKAIIDQTKMEISRLEETIKKWEA